MSVRHKWCYIETDGRIELGFGMAASIHRSYVKRKFGYSKIGVFPSGNLSQSPDLKIFLWRIDRRNVLSTYGPITIAIRARFEYDSSAIQHPTRSYVLSSNNEHVNYSFAGCCSQSAIPRRGFYLCNDVIVTYTVFTCVWRVCSKSIVAAKFTHHEH